MEKMVDSYFFGLKNVQTLSIKAHVVVPGWLVLAEYLTLESGMKGNTGFKWHLLSRTLQLFKIS